MENFVIKAKSTMKKVAAISAGALMMGATIFGAAAAADYTLADYPAPFVTDGQWVGLIVVGADAASDDVAGAIGVAATLAQVASPGATAATTTVSGGKSEDVDIGDALTVDFGSTLDDGDLAGLQDTEISLDNGTDTEDVDIHDYLSVSGSIESATSATNPDEDFGTNVFLELSSGALGYYYTFDDTIPDGMRIDDADDDNPITIDFLGKSLEIVGGSATTMTVQVGEEHFMTVGDTVTVNGKTVELVNVGSATTNPPVVVSVDGVQETVTGTETVNGLRVKVKDTFYADNIEERSATLVIGEDTTKTYTDGDEYIGQPSTDYDWEWDLANLDTGDPTIGVVFARTLDDPDDEGIPMVGGEVDSLTFPNDYISIKLDSFVESNYQKYTISEETEELYYANNTLKDSSEKIIKITGEGDDDAFNVGNGNYTDAIYLDCATSGVALYWEDPDNGNHGLYYDEYAADGNTDADLEYDDTDVDIALNDIDLVGAGGFNITFDFTDQDLNVWVTCSDNDTIAYLGGADGDAQSGDVTVGTVDVSTWSGDARTQDGVILYDIEDNGDSDKVIFDVPEEESTFQATVIISGPETTVTTAGGEGAVSLGGVPVAKLDTEITDKTANHMILVGGPAVNKLTAEAMGLSYPTYGADSGIPEGKGLLKLIDGAFAEGKVALVVAGWNAENTRAASQVLQDYQSYTLSGTEMEVTGTGSSISVGPVTVTETESTTTEETTTEGTTTE